MIVKFLGGLIIILASAAIGFILAQRYVKRVEELRSLQAALHMLEAEISFSLNSLPDALRKIALSVPTGLQGLFNGCCSMLRQKTGITAREAWEQSVERSKKDMHLMEEDYEILIAFGNSLGSTDKEHQVKNIQLACSKLLMQEKKAEGLREKNERMCKNLGILTGMLIVLLLL